MVTGITKNSITLTWKHSQQAGAAATSYMIEAFRYEESFKCNPAGSEGTLYFEGLCCCWEALQSSLPKVRGAGWRMGETQ